MQLTFLSSDLAEMTGKSQEQVRLVLNEWERQSGKPLPRGTSKERVLSLEVASLVLGAFRLMYPPKGKKKHTMGEAVALMLQEAQTDGDHDPLRAAVRAELEPLRRLVMQEVAQHLTPLHQDLRQVSREMVEATREQVAQLVGQPDEDTPTLVEDLRDLVRASEHSIGVLSQEGKDQLLDVGKQVKGQVKEQVTAEVAKVVGQGEELFKRAENDAKTKIENAGKQITEQVVQDIQKALKAQDTKVGLPVLLAMMGATLVIGFLLGLAIGRL